MSEAELAIEEKLRKKRQEEQQAWAEYLEVRAKQRAKEEEELRKLKERQVSVHQFYTNRLYVNLNKLQPLCLYVRPLFLMDNS